MELIQTFSGRALNYSKAACKIALTPLSSMCWRRWPTMERKITRSIKVSNAGYTHRGLWTFSNVEPKNHPSLSALWQSLSIITQKTTRVSWPNQRATTLSNRLLTGQVQSSKTSGTDKYRKLATNKHVKRVELVDPPIKSKAQENHK